MEFELHLFPPVSPVFLIDFYIGGARARLTEFIHLKLPHKMAHWGMAEELLTIG